MKLWPVVSIFIILMVIGGSSPVWATLGEEAPETSPSSLPSQRSPLHKMKRNGGGEAKYGFRDLKIDEVRIREYYRTDSRKVFGIAWKGLTHPDIKSLLGQYSTHYEDESKRSPRPSRRREHGRDGARLSHRILRSDRLIVKQWGHMPALQGQVYDPRLLPQGFDPIEIKPPEESPEEAKNTGDLNGHP